MWQLNLPEYKFNIKKEGEKYYIFDTQRKRHVSLTPEEWVRQNFIQFLIQEKKYPSALIAVESQIKINGMKKRCDAIVYDQTMQPFIIIEFKSPAIAITQQTFDQAAVYNSKLKVAYLIISNGLEHYCCLVDSSSMQYQFMEVIPDFNYFSRLFKT